MVENILVFKKPFLDAHEVIDSVLEMKDGPTIINGKELLSSVSRDDLERYQSLHSVRYSQFRMLLAYYIFIMF